MSWTGHTTRWIVGLAIVLLVGVGGFLVGRRGGTTGNFVTSPGIADASPSGGTAFIGEQFWNRPAGGFAYLLPPNVPWIDATGTVHTGSQPSCLPYYHAERVASMEVTKFPVGGGYMGTVVWVKC